MPAVWTPEGGIQETDTPAGWHPGDAAPTGQLRVGILGAARIAPEAVVFPVQQNADLAAKVVIQAVAARDLAKAQSFAAEHGIPQAFGSYEALLASDEIDAIYNPSPNSLHAAWTIRALAAGKHVLCEKPFTCNAAEAVAIQRASEDTGRIAVEAFHVLHHPVARRARELATSALGKLESVDMQFMVNFEGYDAGIRSKMHAPTPMYEDVRFNSELGGGAMMDLQGLLLHQRAAEPRRRGAGLHGRHRRHLGQGR